MFWNRIANSDDSSKMPALDQLIGRPIGRVLTKMGRVTPQQVIESLKHQKEYGGLLGNVMVKLRFIRTDDIAMALAGQRGERPLPPAVRAG
jgi:hypothetical protein